ncbi:MAG: transposase, partial [Balneolaceae bacterium]|nr:transposase [Balneolaceae bacterium]
FVIMPNHMHAIFRIVANIQELGQPTVGAYGDTPLRDHKSEFKSPSKTVGAIVRGYKSTVTKQINLVRQTPGQKVWQRNYYEHIIRNEKSLNRIRDYILNNPASWEEDQNHPGNF